MIQPPILVIVEISEPYRDGMRNARIVYQHDGHREIYVVLREHCTCKIENKKEFLVSALITNKEYTEWKNLGIMVSFNKEVPLAEWTSGTQVVWYL